MKNLVALKKREPFARATYQIKKSRLSQLYFDNDESLDRAIEGFQRLVRLDLSQTSFSI